MDTSKSYDSSRPASLYCVSKQLTEIRVDISTLEVEGANDRSQPSTPLMAPS